jgi:hypothetical protein
MHDATPQTLGHSAVVNMVLRVNGHVLPIAQMGPDFLVLTQPINHPPADAEITLSIDGVATRWPVRLEHGLYAGERRTAITRCGEVNGSTVVA